MKTKNCDFTRGIQLSRIQFFDYQMNPIDWTWISLHRGIHNADEGPDKLLDPDLGNS